VNKDSSFVNIQTFNELNLALRRGDIDAMVTFPPNSGIALDGGYGEKYATSSGKPELLGDALQARHVRWYPNLDVAQIRKVPATLARLGEIPRDTTEELVDFTFLSKATGRPAEELGKR